MSDEELAIEHLQDDLLLIEQKVRELVAERDSLRRALGDAIHAYSHAMTGDDLTRYHAALTSHQTGGDE